MIARFRSRLTFANVCSFFALLIALGTGSAYAANTVFSTDIVDGEVKTADIANNAVRSTKIGTGQVLNQDLGADAVDGSKIFDASVSAADLGFESVNSGEIATDAVNGSEVAANAIDSDEILDNSLTLFDLGQNSVNGPEITNGAVTSTELADNSVDRRQDPERLDQGGRVRRREVERRDHPELGLRRQRPLPRRRHLSARRRSRRRGALLGQHRPPRWDPALRRPGHR